MPGAKAAMCGRRHINENCEHWLKRCVLKRSMLPYNVLANVYAVIYIIVDYSCQLPQLKFKTSVEIQPRVEKQNIEIVNDFWM